MHRSIAQKYVIERSFASPALNRTDTSIPPKHPHTENCNARGTRHNTEQIKHTHNDAGAPSAHTRGGSTGAGQSHRPAPAHPHTAMRLRDTGQGMGHAPAPTHIRTRKMRGTEGGAGTPTHIRTRPVGIAGHSRCQHSHNTKATTLQPTPPAHATPSQHDIHIGQRPNHPTHTLPTPPGHCQK
jgi:hypothetical protein